jgi:hypothetical protein
MIRRQVDRLQACRLTEVGEDKSIDFKTSRPTEGQSRRKIELENTSQPKQVETTKVEFLKSVFFQVESVKERSNLKVEVKENLNTNWVEAEAIWVS